MTRWTEVSAGVIHAATQRFWGEIGANADDIAHWLINDPWYLNKIAHLAKSGGLEPSPFRERAREIMGQNYYGPEEELYRLGPSLVALAPLGEVPWSEEVLKEVRDTHLLVAVFPRSIEDMGRGSRVSKEPWATDRGLHGWYLVRKEPIDEVRLKMWEEQRALLPQDEEVLSLRVLLYALTMYYSMTGEILFEGMTVRCSDVNVDGCRAVLHPYVGYDDTFPTFEVGLREDDEHEHDLVLASTKTM